MVRWFRLCLCQLPQQWTKRIRISVMIDLPPPHPMLWRSGTSGGQRPICNNEVGQLPPQAGTTPATEAAEATTTTNISAASAAAGTGFGGIWRSRRRWCPRATSTARPRAVRRARCRERAPRRALRQAAAREQRRGFRRARRLQQRRPDCPRGEALNGGTAVARPQSLCPPSLGRGQRRCRGGCSAIPRPQRAQRRRSRDLDPDGLRAGAGVRAGRGVECWRCGGCQRAGGAARADPGARGEDGRAAGAGAAARLGRDAAAVLPGHDGPQASAKRPGEGAFFVSSCLILSCGPVRVWFRFCACVHRRRV